MAIYITEGFHLNSNQPFDIRAVVGANSYYQNKESIQYKFDGLRVWDSNNGKAYVWNGATNTWDSENQTGATIQPGNNINFISKFIDSTTIGRSNIFDTNTHIGIGLTGTNVSPGGGTASGLHVRGNIKTNGIFIGNGSSITDINASSISSGILSLDRIQKISPFTTGQTYVLKFIDNSVSWGLLNTNPFIQSATYSDISYHINFSKNIGVVDELNGFTGLRFNPVKRQITIDGNNTFPTYSFEGNSDKGMYISNNLVTLTSGGGNVKIVPDGINLYSPSGYPQINFDTNSESSTLYIANRVLIFRKTSGVVDDNIIWHDNNLFHLKQVDTNNILEDFINIKTTSAGGNPIKGIYSYSLTESGTMNTSISPIFGNITADKYKKWSNITVGEGPNGGNFQLTVNTKGTSVDREMLVRSFDSGWSDWSRVCLNEISNFRWSNNGPNSTKSVLRTWLNNNLPKTIKTGSIDPGGQYISPKLIPFNPSIASRATSASNDIHGIRPILAQAWHNIEGYDVYYGFAGKRPYIYMFKNINFNNNVEFDLAIETNHCTTKALDANRIWSTLITAMQSGGGFGSTNAADRIAQIPLEHRGKNGFSVIDVYINEQDGDDQALNITLSLQKRTIIDLPS